jgi:M6 family metalloprotease-like protein
MRTFLRENPDLYTFKRAFIQKTERLRENRRLLQEGRLDLRGKTEEDIRRMTVVSGATYVPVLLAKYSDTGANPYPRSDLQDQLFDGPWPTGTMTEYYDEISYGQLDVQGTVYNWVTVSADDDYYSPGSSCGRRSGGALTDEFITEAIGANDGAVDFGDYDNDGPDGVPNSGDDDGYVDFIAIVHPEIGGECGGCEGGHNIWSHRSSLSKWTTGEYTTNDVAAVGGSIKIDDYVIMPALSCDGGMIEIGVFCHEFGHAFGLPDLYDTFADPEADLTCTTDDSEGVGHWCLMGSGNWNSPERPAHMSAWSKARLGWINPGVVAFDLNNFPLLSSSEAPAAYKLWTAGDASDEYFLVEYRTAVGFDDQLHAPGVLIWHIDDADGEQKDECHKRVDLECEDQSGSDHTIDADDLDAQSDRGDATDPFCDGDTFNGASVPSSDGYSGSNTSVTVTDIHGCGNREVFLDLRVGQQPSDVDLCMRDCASDPCTEPSPCDVFWASPEVYIDNNEDGIIDPPAEGIANKLFGRVRNVGTDDATDVDVSFYFADPTMGLNFPSTGDLIDDDNVPLIEPAGSEVASVLWDIPIPPPDISHYCVGVIAENALDAQTDEYAPDDDNVVQINIQELYAKAGDDVPGGARMGAAAVATPFETTQRVMVCNPLHTTCVLTVKIGSPPLFDDAIIPSDWTVQLSATQFPLGPRQCQPLLVRVRDARAVHGDRCVVPLTLLCGSEPVGGTILVFEIDNVGPKPPCTDFRVLHHVPSTDDFPGERAIQVLWSENVFDQQGFPERVERWRVHRGTSEAFVPGPGNLVIETCLDEDATTALYDHFTAAPLDPTATWYKLIAFDRAGNQSEACTIQEEIVSVGIGEPGVTKPSLALDVSNPFRVGDEMRFTLPETGVTSVEVFSLTGRRVRELVGATLEAGEHRVRWDGTDATGRGVANGVYVVRIVSGGLKSSKRFLLLR